MLDTETLRRIIRDVVATEVAAFRVSTVESVRIGGDADLAAFARRVLALAENPEARRAIQAGTYVFRLADDANARSARPDGADAVARIDKGVVTETAVGRLPRGVVKLVLADGVAVTPLARDRARRLGITIERSKP